MSTDNRRKVNDCEANTGWAGDDTANAIATAGSFIEGSGALSTQLSNSDEQMHTTQDTTSAGTYSTDWSDSTLYMNIKDNLMDSFTNGGVKFVVGDAGDLIGYFVGGYDAVGMPGQLFFTAYKLDVSVVVASPGTVNVDFTEFTGTEAGLTQTTCTRLGYGTIHLAKAVGSIDNVIMDGFYSIANGSYALTINGGTVGTPETMTDVAADDVTNGWNLVTNPRGTLYNFFAPTEWGESAAAADHFFEADGEQWFWIGDNSGGHAVGAGNFPFRVIGNTTDTGSFVISNVAIINTGTAVDFDCSDTNIDTLEIDSCSMTGLATFNAPSSGGTSRLCTNTIISGTGLVTHNGADMSGSSVLLSTVAADTGALSYNSATDPDTIMDGMTFSKGTNAHHAIDFGTSVTGDITLRNCEFTGFSGTENVNDSTFRFLATSGSLNLNLIGCTVGGASASQANIGVDDAAGISVTVVISPVTQTVNVKGAGNNIENARVLVETAATIASGEMFEAAVTSLTSLTGTATCTTTAVHGLVTGDYVVIRGAQPDEYNKVRAVTVTSTTVFTYSVPTGIATTATGTPVVSFAAISGLTNASGNISATRTWNAAQEMKGWARKVNATSPFWKQAEISYTINNTSGNTVNAVLQPDE